MTDRRLRIAVAVLSVLGIGVAGYLTIVHYADAQPFCVSGGGGCEKVQTSEQSELLGVPVALLGLIGYVVLLGTALSASEAARAIGALTALVGFGFSMYLTYESIFDIEATCQWCLASAVLMTLLAIVTSVRFVAPSGAPARA